MTIPSSIVWFRQDLRLEDNAALSAAADAAGAVVPLFIHAPAEEGDWPIGRASTWWLHHSLTALSTRLDRIGSPLIVRKGPTRDALRSVAKVVGATAVYMNRRYEPAATARDEAIQRDLSEQGIDVHVFDDTLLFPTDAVRNKSGEPYRVFTPFWKRLLDLEDPGTHSPRPRRLQAPVRPIDSLDIDELDLRGGDEPRGGWQPGEQGAQQALETFLDDVHATYADTRNSPGVKGTSRLSPHLHFGEVSPRRAWFEVRNATKKDAGMSDPFLRQIAWREFSYHVLHHYPKSPTDPLRAAFASFPWQKDAKAFRAWTEGRTGYPFVDAGMRELHTTGWMHNRVRMVAASFLVKHLLIHWHEGARWFWDRLVDADLANNSMGWQWVSGCGADAAPFFRIFNPVMQGRKFDPDGAYVREWVPELAELPDEHLHAPWQCPPDVLRQAGVTLGKNYPKPIVDHALGRGRAIAAYEELDSGQLSIL